MYDGKWFYVIIEDGKFIINNDPHNLDQKLSFLKIKDKKKNRYVLAIYNKKFKLNFVKIDNNNKMELHEKYNQLPIYKALLFDIPDFLWQKKTTMKPLEIEKMTTALTPSSSLFSLSVFLAMALLVI